MTRLTRFLREEFEARGRQAHFCRQVHIEPSAVTKWKKHGDTPNFESCLKIAAYFQMDPYEIFTWAERPDYVSLARRLDIPGGDPRGVQEADLYPVPQDAEQHRMLQELIEAGYGEETRRQLQALHGPRSALTSMLLQLAEDAGAKASCLIADGQIHLDTGASSQERIRMKRGEAVVGWQRIRQPERKGMKELLFYLKLAAIPQQFEVPLTATLKVVSAGLQALSRQSA